MNGADPQAGFGTYRPRPPLYRGVATSSTYFTLRDGVRLAAELMLPKGLPSGTRIPALLQQTRYWRAADLHPPLGWFVNPTDLAPELKDHIPFFTSRGYALVSVDVRGTGASFGTWSYPWADDSVRDAGDIVDWIVAQPWSNGRVGGLGVSYVGTTAELLAVPSHPAVKAIAAMFNHPDAFCDIAFPGGILNRRFIGIWSQFNQALDQNRIPAEFGLLARLVVKGVKPVDREDGRRLLAEAIQAHAQNGNIFRTAELGCAGLGLGQLDGRRDGRCCDPALLDRPQRHAGGHWRLGSRRVIARKSLPTSYCQGRSQPTGPVGGDYPLLRCLSARCRRRRPRGEGVVLLHAGRGAVEADLGLATAGHDHAALVLGRRPLPVPVPAG
jgi:hypothetical protein